MLCDALSCDPNRRGELMAVSGCGSSTEVRAWRAALTGNGKVGFHISFADVGADKSLTKDEAGYTCYTRPLGCNTWHLVAISRYKPFLPSVSEEGVWQYLCDDTTTPLHRSWMPWLMRVLRDMDLLVTLPSWGYLDCGMVRVTQGRLDEIVCAGLKDGAIRIPV